MKYQIESVKYVDGVRVQVRTPQQTPKRQYIQRTVLNTRCYNGNARRQKAIRTARKQVNSLG
jgi:hypothetical protein